MSLAGRLVGVRISNLGEWKHKGLLVATQPDLPSFWSPAWESGSLAAGLCCTASSILKKVIFAMGSRCPLFRGPVLSASGMGDLNSPRSPAVPLSICS